MAIIAADLGGTKLAVGIYSDDLEPIQKEKVLLGGREGTSVGRLIQNCITRLLRNTGKVPRQIKAIGVSVPGIYDDSDGTVWAPNIPGWEKYPLLTTLQKAFSGVPVIIHSDRSCYITAEITKGVAKGCKDAVFIAIGTGIGAGIISGGRLIRGANDIAGAAGWMALDKPFRPKYAACGCLESTASGDGIVRHAIELIEKDTNYQGPLKHFTPGTLTAEDIFQALENNDQVAKKVINHCIEMWGMALANIVSLLNPEMVIFGGGVFGAATHLIPKIVKEAEKWAQPISMKKVSVKTASLGPDAGLLGAASLALNAVRRDTDTN